jgi:hypothetical protein
MKNINQIIRTKTALESGDLLVGRDDTGDFKTSSLSVGTEFLANSYRNYVIDGDFNHWNNGTNFSIPIPGDYGPDMWELGPTAGTITREDNIDSDVENYFLRFDASGEIDLGESYLQQTLKDITLLRNKSVSCFARMRSTTGVTDIEFKVTQVDGTAFHIYTSSTLIDIEASPSTWAWYRWDLEVEFPQTYNSILNNVTIITLNKKTAQDDWIWDIDKVRVIETPEALPPGIIPEWVKQDEDREATQRIVKQYYIKQAGGTATGAAPVAWGSGISTTEIIMTIPIENEMVQDPTVTLSASYVLIDATTGVTLTLSSATISNVVTTQKNVMFKITNGAATVVNNRAYYCIPTSARTLEIDARY